MGQEISSSRFTRADFNEFECRLREETQKLKELEQRGRLSKRKNVVGVELEAWLVDEHARPLPINEVFLRQMADPMVVPELSAFNVELNVEPQVLTGNAIRLLRDELVGTWNRCRDTARHLGADLVAIGILPTVHDGDLTVASMSDSERYRALNEQILNVRGGKPLVLNIQGRQHLEAAHGDVMLEAATTSLQLHLQVSAAESGRVYNAALIASAALVAISANSPYLFGHDLWDESRIPLFEQAIGAGPAGRNRVTFGDRFETGSLVSCFEDNLDRYPILLPSCVGDEVDHLSHLRLHNGTIWRWNRPLVGFDPDGTPHLRIEHRVIPAGPTVVDSFANAALFWGLTHRLANEEPAAETQIGFDETRWNFYEAARYGLHCSTTWLDGRRLPMRDVIIDYCLPMAIEGLQALGIDATDIDYFLGVIAERTATGQNGASWQRRWVAHHGFDVRSLTESYMRRQNSEIPVHEWGT